MNKLQNKVAVVTGGNSGIGFSAAKDFIAQGAKVIITGKNQSAIDIAVTELGGQATGILANVANVADTEVLVQKVKEQYGGLDILFINAGMAGFSPIEYVSEEQFDQIMDVNFKGAFFTLSRFLPLLKEGSSVVLLSSISAAQVGIPNSAVYSASKAAMNALVNVAAYELAPKKIRVNAVSPGSINTPGFGKLGLDEKTMQAMMAAFQNRIPMKRVGTAEEVAKLVSYLASEDAAFITGSNFVIDGGVSLNPVIG